MVSDKTAQVVETTPKEEPKSDEKGEVAVETTEQSKAERIETKEKKVGNKSEQVGGAERGTDPDNVGDKAMNQPVVDQKKPNSIFVCKKFDMAIACLHHVSMTIFSIDSSIHHPYLLRYRSVGEEEKGNQGKIGQVF